MIVERTPLRVVVLGAWSLAPVMLLVLRALAPSWPFPGVWPVPVDLTRPVASLTSGRLLAALFTSVLLALAVGVVSTALGFTVGRAAAGNRRGLRHLVTGLALLEVIAPPIALGVGLQVAIATLGLGGTATGVGLGHLVPAVGYVTLFALGVFTDGDFAMDDEARTLGATRWQVLWRVTVPMLRSRLLEGVLLGALVSWGQLAITVLIGGGLVRTLPVELLAFVRSGDDQLGAAASLVLMVPPMLGLGVLGAFRLAARRAGVGL